jgi:hypothetical protein
MTTQEIIDAIKALTPVMECLYANDRPINGDAVKDKILQLMKRL